jgi:hypothetical protein
MLAAATTIKDVALGAAPWVVGGRNFRFDAITPDDLTAVLPVGQSGAQVKGISIEPVSTGTTDRVRLSLTWNREGQQAGLPSSLFAKGTPSTLSSRIIVSTFGLSDY